MRLLSSWLAFLLRSCPETWISDNKNLHKIVIALRFIANTRIIRSGNDEM